MISSKKTQKKQKVSKLILSESVSVISGSRTALHVVPAGYRKNWPLDQNSNNLYHIAKAIEDQEKLDIEKQEVKELKKKFGRGNLGLITDSTGQNFVFVYGCNPQDLVKSNT